jgi:putative glutamine amidotransferase
VAERPVIGLTGGATLVPIVEGHLDSHYVGRAYARAILEAGGLPLMLPAAGPDPAALAEEYLEHVDALVLSGGIDIAPEVYGGGWPPAQTPDPPRDAFEVALVRQAAATGVPVLGVCRGMQMINVALGGTLHRHVEHAGVEARDEGTFEGVRLHAIPLEPDSLVRRVLGRDRVDVLCLHHQAPDRIGDGLRVGATADDGIVEVVEGEDGFLLGVLWHPEQMLDSAPLQGRLYRGLVEAAELRRAGV